MSAKLAQILLGTAVLALLVYCALRGVPGGQREWWPAKPSPTPIPTPTPVFVRQKKFATSKLFNDMEVHTKLESEPGGTATQERETPESYGLELSVKVKVPRPNQDLEALTKLNKALPQVLPGLAGMLKEAKVSEKYEALYGRKLAQLQRNLSRLELDLLLSRHNFFDCETILELRDPTTHRTAVLVQADMDVDTDGSDPDRLPAVDPSDPTFQPMTSYRWPKQTPLSNPFLPSRLARFHVLEAEAAHAKKMGEPRLQALREAVNAARYEVDQLKTQSFLLAATDPYVVLPGLLTEGMSPAFQPRVGDYCAVIHGETIYPAIVGDVGPRELVGEASLRLGKEINSETTALHRAESNLKVTYVFFPDSADIPFGPPDLPKWRARVEALLHEIGGYGGTLHTWTNLSKPAPTPTPPPTPTPTPTPGELSIPGISPSLGGTSAILSGTTTNLLIPKLQGLPASPTPSPTPMQPIHWTN